MKENYWDKLSGTDEAASVYMLTYGEGPGCKTRLELGSFINDGESVLDVGCGPGWNFDHFMLHGPAISNYRGLDYSERFVRVANDRAKQVAKTSTGPFRLGDVREIAEPDESWDVVVMQDVLEHTNGYEGPVREALRVAKKRCIFTFWHLMADKEEDNPVNDDGDDGWGAWYSGPKWEKFLDSLDLHWVHHQFNYPENRVRDFYIVDKEAQHGISSV